MDDDLKLADKLLFEATAGYMTSVTRDVMAEAAAPIPRLRAEITQMTDTIDGLEFQRNDAWSEIERLKSDVSDLVRAGSDEATENERLVKERDEANSRVRAITEVLNFSAEQTQKAEAQRDAALQLSTLTSSRDEVKALADAIAQRDAALEALDNIHAIACVATVGEGVIILRVPN